MELLSLEEEGVTVAPLPDLNKQEEFEDIVKKEQFRPSLCAEEAEDSAVVSDDDFFDAHEYQSLNITEDENANIALGSNSSQHTTSLNVIEKEENANNSDTSKEEAIDVELFQEKSKSKRELDDEYSRSREEKYVIKNKDTGETFDIREMNSTSIDSYTMFPNDFTLPQNQDQPEKQIKKTGSGLSKLKVKFPKKSKVKETTKKKTNIQVLCNKKERRDFEELILAQTLSQHNGTIWTMKFSHDGARLVTGGQDAILRVWKVAFSGDDSPTVETTTSASSFTEKKILENEPEQSYQGHTMPIVDVSWSRSNFILSASMDKTVRLWHISREDCLHVFQHPDSVPAVDFHPKEDRFFLSGCFDNKARIWDIPDGCVVSYAQTPVMITAATFNPSGSRAIVGLLNGQCIFYQVNVHQQMNYYTQIECRNSRGPMKKGRKVTGIEFDPEGKYFMVSTNDSRMRLYSVDNYSRMCKYKGLVNDHLQIKGRFSQDGEFVICGSENGHVYIWNKSSSYLPSMRVMKSGKQDRNASYEYFNATDIPCGIVTAALFAPASTYAMVKNKLQAAADIHSNACTGLIVTATYDGNIKFFEKTGKSYC